MDPPHPDLPQPPEPERPHEGLSDDELAAQLEALRVEHEHRQQKDDGKRGWFPRPPKVETAADFIVIVFACTVAGILVALTVATIVAAFTGTDIKPYFAILTSIMTSLISALVGYLAGRSQGGPPPPPPLL